MAKPQASEAVVLGGRAISSGLVTTSSSTGPGVANARWTAASSCSGSVDPDAGQAEGLRDGGQIGIGQHRAELGQPTLLLLQLDHAQPAVVEDDDLDRELVRDGRDQVAEQHRQAAVAAQRDDLAVAVQGLRAERLRQARWPSIRG